MSGKRILLFGNDDFSLWHFRRALIEKLLSRGHSVSVLCPPGKYCALMSEMGARVIVIAMPRFIAPFRDLKVLFTLMRIMHKGRFDLVHTMTIKPNIYGTLVAALWRVPRRVSLVSGLGAMFVKQRGILELRQTFIRTLYRLAFRFCHKVWCQNADDYRRLIDDRILRPGQGIVIRGSGINPRYFCRGQVPEDAIQRLRSSLSLLPATPCVLLVAARMIRSKGVLEFLAAAHELGSRYPDWRFLLVAPFEAGNPDSVPKAFLEFKCGDNVRIIDQFQDDIRPYYELAEIVTLPSYYPEGVPRSLLEAMAFSRPIVTTDMPGCKETVEANQNGFLIPPRDSNALADALETLMSDASLRRRMGDNSRLMVEREFSEERVVLRVLVELYGFPVEESREEGVGDAREALIGVRS